MVPLLVLSLLSPEVLTLHGPLQLSVSNWQLVLASMFVDIPDLSLVTLPLCCEICVSADPPVVVDCLINK